MSYNILLKPENEKLKEAAELHRLQARIGKSFFFSFSITGMTLVVEETAPICTSVFVDGLRSRNSGFWLIYIWHCFLDID